MAHPYEPWTRTAPPGGSGDDMNVSSWWDLHPGPGSWMDLSAGPGVGVGLSGMSQGTSMGLQSALGPYCHEAQLCSLPQAQLGLTSHPHLFPQDGFKMEPLGAPELLPQQQQQQAQQQQQQQQQQQVYTLEEPQEGATSVPRPKSQRRSGSRASGQAVCRCPNCVHAEQLGGQGEDGRLRKHMHNCHIPGCGKAYAKTSHLKAHLRWHSGDRPFVCNWLFCGKRFTRADELQKHMQTHTGAKKFSCAVCTRVFMRSDHLAKHMRTHDSSASASGGAREDRANGEGAALGLPPSPLGTSATDGAEGAPRKLKCEPDANLDIMPGQTAKLS